ncbi:MAG: hypothetical protein RQ966_13515 [Acetobacteraceae bacterium]|nr:hypothetical protein [Acetobacteraceae bacterium]
MSDEPKTAPFALESVATKEHDDQIAWLLAHPGVSDWLKAALRSGTACNPVELMNDIDLLSFVLRRRAQAVIATVLPQPPPAPHD